MDPILPSKGENYLKPSKGLPERFKTPEIPQKENPYKNKFLTHLLHSKQVEKPAAVKLETEAEVGTLAEGKEKVSRSKIEKQLGKMYDPYIPFNKEEREGLVSDEELSVKKYGPYMNAEKLKKHQEELEKQQRRTSDRSEQETIKRKLKLWDRLKNIRF